MALVMVRAAERSAPSVRLVQDFGSPDDPDPATLDTGAPATTPVATAAPAPPKRGRGRQPGSRTRKPSRTRGANGRASMPGAPPQENPEIPGIPE
jgi:hypothetical protein